MKKFTYYTVALVLVIIILPLIIVRGCSIKVDHDQESDQELDQEIGLDEAQDENQNSNVDKGQGGDQKDNKTVQPKGIKIKVFVNSKNKVEEMDLEQYVRGVVAAEMPANFELEALKAQAVAARTYALGRIRKIYVPKDNKHEDADVCTDPGHCQAWISKDDAYRDWGIFASKGNWNKVSKAVIETKGLVITYNNSIANPLFHSNSGGRTENSEDVWEGTKVPYLRSVVSYGEEEANDYKKVISMKEKDFRAKLTKEYADLKFRKGDFINNIEILNYTKGGRVNTIQVGNKVIKGTDLRRIFDLNSTNIKIKEKKGIINITTIGNGHGVGMSQWGANYLAKQGMAYKNILEYYYTGVSINTLN